MKTIKKLFSLILAFTLTVTSLNLTVYADPVPTFTELAAKIALVDYKSDQIINQMNSTYPNLTDLEKALYLHDWLVMHVNYDNDESNLHNRTAYGAIVDNEAVCLGYSNAYKYLLSKVSITAKDVLTESLDHAWNLVTINNKNYYVDCTWEHKTDPPLRTNKPTRWYFLLSRDSFHDGRSWNETIEGVGYSVDTTEHNSEDWKYSTVGSENVYNTVQTSTDYDDYSTCNWREYDYTFDDSIFNESYSQETTSIEMNGYAVAASYDEIFLINKIDTGNLYFDESNNYNIITSESLSASEAANYYIHDISADGTTVTYHTWLKDNGSESTQQTHTIDWSQYFTGSVGSNVTWSYLNGTLTLSGTGAMDDYSASNTCPWADFFHDITTIDIGSGITDITLTFNETNLATVNFDGSLSQWNDRAENKGMISINNITLNFSKHDVVFKNKNGSTIQTSVVNNNSTVSAINAPTVSNYTFVCWCSDTALNNPFDFTQPVTSNTTLYPKYKKTYVTVTFYTNGGSSVSRQRILNGNKISQPSTSRTNYTLEGWYTDSNLSTRFNFNNPITDDTNLYAKWNENQKVTVTFYVDGSYYSQTQVYAGNRVSSPGTPTRYNNT
ncbi:MAG: InlB B-repeat-containing protein, partial [Lachnospiraceae bacterium]|nr:InlB B-repeat-containing protein [Lachnospiraceae bacterium]